MRIRERIEYWEVSLFGWTRGKYRIIELGKKNIKRDSIGLKTNQDKYRRYCRKPKFVKRNLHIYRGIAVTCNLISKTRIVERRIKERKLIIGGANTRLQVTAVSFCVPYCNNNISDYEETTTFSADGEFFHLDSLLSLDEFAS